MPAPSIRSIEFIDPPAEGRCRIQVQLEDGTFSSFMASTPDDPGRRLEDGFSYGSPVLFVRTLDAAAVREAVEAMAAEMGGYWLRYCNSLGDLLGAAKARPAGRPKIARKRTR